MESLSGNVSPLEWKPAHRFPNPENDEHYCPTCDRVREPHTFLCGHCGVFMDSPPPNVISLCARRQIKLFEQQVAEVGRWMRSRGLL